MSRILLPDTSLLVDVNAIYNDIYWGVESVEVGDNCEYFNKALCLNQNGFKKFTKECDYDVEWDVCFSEERYPHKYPCIVQLLTHFEGSMIYTAIKYDIPEEYNHYLKSKGE